MVAGNVTIGGDSCGYLHRVRHMLQREQSYTAETYRAPRGAMAGARDGLPRPCEG